MSFTIRTQTDERRARIEVAGELDIETAPQLASCLAEHGPRIELDLRNVSFMDSTGLRVLIATETQLREAGGALVITASDAVHRIISLCGLEERLLSPRGG